MFTFTWLLRVDSPKSNWSKVGLDMGNHYLSLINKSGTVKKKMAGIHYMATIPNVLIRYIFRKQAMVKRATIFPQSNVLYLTFS